MPDALDKLMLNGTRITQQQLVELYTPHYETTIHHLVKKKQLIIMKIFSNEQQDYS